MKAIALRFILFLFMAALTAAAQQHKVILPPEFAIQGRDNIPLSPRILVGDTLYGSGEIGFDSRTGEIPKTSMQR